MTLVLGMAMLGVAMSFSDCRKLLTGFIIDKFEQSELGMVYFTQRQMLLVLVICFSLLSFIVH